MRTSSQPRQKIRSFSKISPLHLVRRDERGLVPHGGTGSRTIAVIARHELLLSVRSAWTLTFALIFAVLVTAIAYFGLRAEGFTGVQGFTRTSASLLNLVLYIVPLAALTLGVFGFTDERSSAELLFAQPILRSEILLGKLLGLFGSLTLSTLIGFGIAGAVIVSQVGVSEVSGYLILVGLSLMLGLVFLSQSALLSMFARQKMKAFGLAIASWFFFVIFYDLIVIAGTTMLRGAAANTFVFLSLFGNPVDMVRVGSLLALDGVAIFGVAGTSLIRYLGGASASAFLLIAALGFWIVAPLLLALRSIKRQDV
jgi:Cu-processing system permease protein